MKTSTTVVWAVVAMVIATIASVTAIIESSRNPAPLLGVITMVIVPAIVQLLALIKTINKVDIVQQQVTTEEEDDS